MYLPNRETDTPALLTEPIRIAIGVATRGRASILGAMLRQVSKQTRQPDRIVICCTQPQDVADLPPSPHVEIITAPPGLPCQRNNILDCLDDCDIVVFLDDDFLMDPHYIEATEMILRLHPNIVATTGDLLADGARGPGYRVDDARALLDTAPPPTLGTFIPAPHGYGCNMAIRLEVARTHQLRFDERLPLYGWSEDIDFTHRIGRHGDIAKIPGARGVHLGAKQGRTSGRRLGYSQVANPIYLYVKGSYSFRRAAGSVGRNVAMNVAKALWSEPYIDRRGRLGGNARAMFDLVIGRMQPERILEI